MLDPGSIEATNGFFGRENRIESEFEVDRIVGLLGIWGSLGCDVGVQKR